MNGSKQRNNVSSSPVLQDQVRYPGSGRLLYIRTSVLWWVIGKQGGLSLLAVTEGREEK